MALYPQLPRPVSPYPFKNIRPSVSGGPLWSPQTRYLTRYGLLTCDVAYKGRSFADILTLWNFFETVGGQAGRFTFVDFNGIGPIGGSDPGVPWSGLYVAKGDGVTTTWDLPSYAGQADLTSVVASLTAGTRTVTPLSMSGIVVGATLTAMNADGSNYEVVTVTATTQTTFTAVFAQAKASNWLVHAPLVFDNGTAVTTYVSPSPGPGVYGVVFGAGTDGVDQLKAGTAPASGHILTVALQCRRALRRAKFVADVNPFVYNVPTNYEGQTVTIQEVRK